MIYAIFPNGITQNFVVNGRYYGTEIIVYPHKCYFDRYKIDDCYYWYYDQEKIYHIEDSKTGKVLLISINDNPDKVIDDFLKIKEELL